MVVGAVEGDLVVGVALSVVAILRGVGVGWALRGACGKVSWKGWILVEDEPRATL